MRLDIHIHLDGPITINCQSPTEVPEWGMEALERLEELARVLARVEVKEDIELMNIQDIQSTADETLVEVQNETQVSEAVKVAVDHQNEMLDALAAQIAELQSANDPQALQKLSDTIAAIKATSMSNSSKVAEAVVAGTSHDAPAGGGGGDTGGDTGTTG